MELPTNLEKNVVVADRPHSIVDCLQKLALSKPKATAYVFLENGETETDKISYRELDEKARAIASHLQSYKGERALLVYPSGLEFIAAFFGCLYAGVIAVPVYPPRRNQKLDRLLAIINNCEAKIALTEAEILGAIAQRWGNETTLTELKWIATEELAGNSQEFEPEAMLHPQRFANPSQNLAFLQYTSGSTGTPKGVMVTHGNIVQNLELIRQAFCHSDKSMGVGWLPLFHDMGLIGHVLQPIYVGFPSILMPPVAFLMKPIRWLKAISKYRATTSGGPNFAYDLCVQKVKPEQLANLDLSSWDLAYNGAEPIRAKTLEQFSEKFAPCGFKKEAFYPCYGMAETTLFATGGEKKEKPIVREIEEENRRFVGCGSPYLDAKVVIVNPELLTICKGGEVGEIWISGGSIAAGYWNNDKATKETFKACLPEMGEGHFLRTGDLGFLSNGELFVTGRLKDLIIIDGRNHYPQDIEKTVEECHPAIRKHCVAAFSLENDDGVKLAIAAEIERKHRHNLDIKEVIKSIRRSVSEERDLRVDIAVLLKYGTIPKTSSGKIQRYACQANFQAGKLEILA